jgi:hypothetical protein
MNPLAVGSKNDMLAVVYPVQCTTTKQNNNKRKTVVVQSSATFSDRKYKDAKGSDAKH